jgi:hypothetical protein
VVTALMPNRSFTWVATGLGGTRVTLAMEQAGPVGVVMGRFYRRLTDRYLTAEAEGDAVLKDAFAPGTDSCSRCRPCPA